jgi:hypothetical protein
MQAGDRDARVRRRGARHGQLRRAQAVRLVGQRVRRDFQAVISELRRVLALLRERHRRDHFVAEGDSHFDR